MNSRTCKNCAAWHHEHQCRRGPPVNIADDLSDETKAIKPWATPQVSSLWPSTSSDDWCTCFVDARPWWKRVLAWLKT